MNNNTTDVLWPTLCADLVRLHGQASFAGLLRAYFTYRTYRPIVTLRLCKAAAVTTGVFRVLLPLFRLFHKWNCGSAGMDLSWQANIGPGLAVTHGWGLVVSPGATIGKNCTLFHGATLGQADKISSDGVRETGFPVLEDDVWVGPHALVVGNVRVGRGSRILGGAFVTQDVPPRTMVGGNPAQILKRGIEPDVVNPICLMA